MTTNQFNFEYYNSLGFALIPVWPRSKIPAVSEWQKRTQENNNLNEFTDDSNIGIALGVNSGGYVDVDLDHHKALQIADMFLPETRFIYGRASNPESHRFYKVENSGGSQKFQFGGLGTIIEYRAEGSQSVVPPSVHPSSEAYEFHSALEPAIATRDELLLAVSKIASAVVISEHWTVGQRHDVSLALAGALERLGWDTPSTPPVPSLPPQSVIVRDIWPLQMCPRAPKSVAINCKETL